MRIRRLWPVMLCSWLIACASEQESHTALSAGPDPGNNLLYALAWKQTAAEYEALYFQGFNMARLHLLRALEDADGTGRPLAVISDLDDTLLLARDYWGYLVETDQDFFDDTSWDRWVREAQASPSPGALEFLRFCVENGVEVFYVTNRDQGEATFDLVLSSLQALGFPYADAEHLTVLRESSNKEPAQNSIRENFDVVVMLGDNLNDFSRQFYLTDVAARLAAVDGEKNRFGTEYILFPNPTDGHWLRAIFGESEPASTAINRQILRNAAMHRSWQPGS